MAQEFDFVLTNATPTESQIGILSPTSINSQKSTKFRAVTPYVTSYPINSTFIFRTNDTTYTYLAETVTTPQDIVNQFNNQFDIGDVSLFANNAVDGTVYEIVSPYSFIELEINQSVATWVAQTATTNGNTSVSFINDLEGIIGCQFPTGLILNTSDGGANWTAVNAGGASTFLSVKALPSGIGFACGLSGKIRRASNFHTSLAWTAQVSGTVDNLFSIFFIDDNNGWCVGSSGTILFTSNSGTTWTPQISPTGLSLRSVFFIDANNGWICGASGIVLNTTDGGTNWNTLSSAGAFILNSIFFVDLLTGWVVGQGGIIYKSIDGGATWSNQHSGGVLKSIFMIDANNGWACGAGEIVLNTTNGGATWTPETLGSGTENLSGIYFPSLTKGWVVGGDVSFTNIIFKYS